MNKWLTKRMRAIILLTMTLILFSLSGVFLFVNGQEGLVLFVLFSFVGFVGIIGGLIPVLSLTLFLFFLIGSIFFWMTFGSSAFESTLSLSFLFLWMVKLLILALVTGRLHHDLREWDEENTHLHEQISTLVAIDADTGFDNKERMLFELESEFSRSKRYGQTFSFLLMRIRHFDQLEKLYGQAEEKRILNHLAMGIYRHVRKSDLKFRPEKDLIGLLLVQTDEEDVQHVIDKLNRELTVFQLENKKYITLEFDYGVVSYHDELADYTTVYELAKEQVSFHVS